MTLKVAVARGRYAVLAAVAAALLAARWGTTGDWTFFQLAGGVLRSPDRLRLYLDHPDVQIGPLALVTGLPFTLVGWGAYAVKALIFACGLGCIRCIELLTRELRGDAAAGRLLAGGLLFLPVWSFVATSAHLDDALAILGVFVAMVTIARDRAVAAGLLLGLACAAKPWAVLALPVLLALPQGRRLRAVALSVLVPALSWLPFLVSAPGSVGALGRFHIALMPSSALHLVVGLPTGTAYPVWVRPLQLGVALLAALWVVRRGSWWAVPAVAFGVRLVLDPGSTTYYGGGLAAGGLLVDLLTATSLPMLSLAVAVGVALPTYLELYLIRVDQVAQALRLASQAAYLRLGASTAVVALAVLARRPTRASADTTGEPMASVDAGMPAGEAA